jgi:hypothetical protein
VTHDNDDEFIGMTDHVEHKLNTNVFGIVIGLAGSLRYVRISPSLAVLPFHEWELRLIGKATPPATKEELPTNVVDFTKAKELRKDTKTEGAA